eukprot:COSAG02_NODE_9001_length_2361_cov_3.831788_1_plen_310_part_00
MSDLATFLDDANLSDYQPKLEELGVAAPADIADVEDADFEAMGMKGLEVKRVRRKLEELNAGSAMVVPDYATENKAQPMGMGQPTVAQPAVVQGEAMPQQQMMPQQHMMPQQQQMMPPGGVNPMGSLFGCFDDCGICLCGYFCYCCLAGQTHERAGLDSGPAWKIPTVAVVGMVLSQCLVGVACQCLAFYWCCKGRQDIQVLVGAQPDDDITACLTYFCCMPCAICQEARAVNAKWEANGRQPLRQPGMMQQPGMMPQPGMMMQQQPGMMQQQPGMMQQQPGMMMQQQPGMMMQQQPMMQQPAVQRLER